MPFQFTKDGLNDIRDDDSIYDMYISSNDYIEEEEIFISLSGPLLVEHKTFDIDIHYTASLTNGEAHFIDISNNFIDARDNIVVNVASEYRYLTVRAYNIKEGSCTIEMIYNGDEEIPYGWEDEGGDIIRLTVAIIN